MSEIEPKPGEAGAGDALDTKENLNPDGTAKAGNDGEDDPSDPLDDIKDPKARAEAKAHRAIARRKAKERNDDEGEDEEDPTPVDTSKYATKEDLKKIATNDAKKLVPEHIKNLWSELAAIPLGGFDPLDAESIAANMSDRFDIYVKKNPDKAPDPSVEFTTTSVVPNGTGGGSKKSVARELPGYKESTQPDDWYKAPTK